MSVWRHIYIVLVKELTDGFRDRRSLASALLFPLFGPVLIAFMFTTIVEDQASERPLSLPVAGAKNAPALIEHLERQGVEIEEPPDDPQTAVSRGEVPMVLVVPPDYAESFRAGRSIRLELINDGSRRDTQSLIARVQAQLEGYRAKVGTLRLLARGVHPEVVRPIAVVNLDVSTPQQRAANILNVVPMFVLLAAFIGGMFLATDSTAGERERKSLEPLLLNPVSRHALAFGKWLATVTLSVISSSVTLIGSIIALSRVPLEKIGLSFELGWGDGLALAAAVIPLSFLAGAVQLLVASFARSFREAQTYLSLLTLAPTLPGVLLVLKPLQTEPWMLFVPILGQQTLLMDTLRGGRTDAWMYVVAGTAVLGLALIAVMVTAWLFTREKTLFGD